MAHPPVFSGLCLKLWVCIMRKDVNSVDYKLWKVISHGPHVLPEDKTKWTNIHNLKNDENVTALNLMKETVNYDMFPFVWDYRNGEDILDGLYRIHNEKEQECLMAKRSDHSSDRQVETSSQVSTESEGLTFYNLMSLYNQLLDRYKKIKSKNKKWKIKLIIIVHTFLVKIDWNWENLVIFACLMSTCTRNKFLC